MVAVLIILSVTMVTAITSHFGKTPLLLVNAPATNFGLPLYSKSSVDGFTWTIDLKFCP